MARVRRILGGAKVGHAGTLDPDATGVLVICVGKATKISSFLMEADKVYCGRGRLGVTTETQDGSGAVSSRRPVEVSAEEVRTAAQGFVGEIQQVPPMYSAVKIGGKKLYRLARAGVEVERVARPVTVHSLEIGAVELPDFRFEARCSKGTYVRTLVHDLGEALGCGGHLAELSRRRQGLFRQEDALPWGALESPDAADRIRSAVVSPAEALAFLPELSLPSAAEPLRVGALLPPELLPEGAQGLVRLVGSDGTLIGVGRRSADGLRPLHLLPPPARFGRGKRGS